MIAGSGLQKLSFLLGVFFLSSVSVRADCLSTQDGTLPIAEAEFAVQTIALVKPLTGDPKCPYESYRKLLPAVDAARFLDGKALAKRVLNDEGKLTSGSEYTKTLDPTLIGMDLRNSEPIDYKESEADQKAINDWVLSKKLFSVQPHQFFEQALKIAGGDTERALFLSWNYLEDKNISTILERNTREKTLRLHDVTGEAPVYDKQSKKTFLGSEEFDMRGDNFSAWYHFFGTALYGYVRERTGSWSGLPTDWVVAVEYTTKTRNVLYTKKRRAIDSEGGEFGKQLGAYVNAQTKVDPKKDAAKDVSDYLYDDTKRYDEKYVTRKEDHSQEPMTAMEKVYLAKILAARKASVPEKARKCLIHALSTDPDKEIADYMKYLAGDTKAHQSLMDKAANYED